MKKSSKFQCRKQLFQQKQFSTREKQIRSRSIFFKSREEHRGSLSFLMPYIPNMNDTFELKIKF